MVGTKTQEGGRGKRIITKMQRSVVAEERHSATSIGV